MSMEMIRVEPAEHPFGLRRKRTRRRPHWHVVGHVATAQVTRPYLLGVVPVTHELYSDVTGEQLLPTVIAERTDKRRRRRELVPGVDQCPVDSLTWYDAIRFCNQLSKQHGYQPAYDLGEPDDHGAFPVLWRRTSNGYRLPTEVEWELAATAGCTFKTPGGAVDQVAWHRGNSAHRGICMPHPVALKRPNRWGLYDMAGNAFEWCWDEKATIPDDGPLVDWAGPAGSSHSPDQRGPYGGAIVKGGTARHDKIFCRIAERESSPRTWGHLTGLRLARTAS